MRAVVFGYHAMGCLGFDALLRHGFEVPAVFTHKDDPHEEIWWDSLAERARARGAAVHYPASMNEPDSADDVASYAPDVLLSFYFRYMIPPAVLAVAPGGAFNLHGSLLPRFRGRAPVNWALVKGATETGVTLHAMVEKPDAGEIYDQERVAIDPADTAYTVFRKLEPAATLLLDRFLPALREGRAVGRPMDISSGSYFGGRKPKDGELDWTRPATALHDLVRAVTHPYPGAFTAAAGRKLFVWWAVPVEGRKGAAPGTVLAAGADGVTVAAGEGALRLIIVQREREPELPANALFALEAIGPGSVLGPQ